jgi:hypothetical protein
MVPGHKLNKILEIGYNDDRHKWKVNSDRTLPKRLSCLPPKRLLSTYPLKVSHDSLIA